MTIDEPALFPVEPYLVALAPDAEPGEKLSPGRRLTLRQAEAVARGVHPLALPGHLVRIHPQADPDRTATPASAAARPLRCGTCRWREQVSGGANNYPKCVWRPTTDVPGPDGRHLGAPPRYSAGPATDCRSWWPACSDWQPREDVT